MRRKESNVSIIDIAKKTGLSVATVSRVINGYQFVKPATRENVLSAIAELGFSRNSIASSLRSKKTYTIGMIVPRVSMYFHAEVITVVQNELQAKGYNLFICQSNDDSVIEKNQIISLINFRVDGVIVACSIFADNFDNFNIFQKKNIPVVFYDRVPLLPRANVRMIKGDDYQGGCLAAMQLIKGNCKNIAAVFGPLTSNLYIDRSAGFIDTLKKHDIKIAAESIFYQELTHEKALQALIQLFSGGNHPDGIFFANDTSAIAAVEFAKENGIAIPDQLQIIGYSNDPRTTIISPSITTIEQYPKQFGCEAVKKIMDLINQDPDRQTESDNSPTIIPVKLIQRMSTIS
jgi:LacI family transcriptional regulator